jgi:ornithine decarboxylase
MSHPTLNYRPPCLTIDLNIVRSNYLNISEGLVDADIFFSLKSCHDVRVIECLYNLGAGFDIASRGELDLLKGLRIPPHKIVFSSTVKAPLDIQVAFEYGVRHFAIDSYDEVDKLAKLAPNCLAYARIIVDNTGSKWPLTKKFGVEEHSVISLMQYAKENGLKPIGITFHVGSQCLNPEVWRSAMQKSRRLFQSSKEVSLDFSMLNLGGGFPTKYSDVSTPQLSTILSVINQERWDSGVKIWVEPGRYIVGSAGILSTTVIGVSCRDNKKWVYLDVGIYNGLFETTEGIVYKLEVVGGSTRAVEQVVLAGPSCDSTDVIFENIELPAVAVGDVINIHHSGAYTTSYQDYNGLHFPQTLTKD